MSEEICQHPMTELFDAIIDSGAALMVMPRMQQPSIKGAPPIILTELMIRDKQCFASKVIDPNKQLTDEILEDHIAEIFERWKVEKTKHKGTQLWKPGKTSARDS